MTRTLEGQITEVVDRGELRQVTANNGIGTFSVDADREPRVGDWVEVDVENGCQIRRVKLHNREWRP